MTTTNPSPSRLSIPSAGTRPVIDAGKKPTSKVELFRLALREEENPEPFYTKLAERAIAELPFPITGRRILDLGAGPGFYSMAMTGLGATVAAIDLGTDNCRGAKANGIAIAEADGTRLPFPDATFDGVLCSNMLEHTPTPERIFAEIERIVRPGGWAWVSWTNWYSPWGGHSITPLHYLGPHLGAKVYTKLFGRPDRNLPFETLWPCHISDMLNVVAARPGLQLLDAVPRYYPSQRWIVRVPGLREVITWNCLLLLQRTA